MGKGQRILKLEEVIADPGLLPALSGIRKFGISPCQDFDVQFLEACSVLSNAREGDEFDPSQEVREIIRGILLISMDLGVNVEPLNLETSSQTKLKVNEKLAFARSAFIPHSLMIDNLLSVMLSDDRYKNLAEKIRNFLENQRINVSKILEESNRSEILSRDIDHPNFQTSLRLYNRLRLAGLKNFYQIVEVPVSTYLSLPSFGQITLNELKARLAEYGHALRSRTRVFDIIDECFSRSLLTSQEGLLGKAVDLVLQPLKENSHLPNEQLIQDLRIRASQDTALNKILKTD